MEVVENFESAGLDQPRLALTIGSFDGVHLGHRRVLDELHKVADRAGAPTAVLTMRPHPREFFSPDHAPNLLTTERRKFELLDEAGVDLVLVLNFTRNVADMPPDEFAATLIGDRCNAQAVVIGHDFCFGRNAEGDVSTLRELGARLGFDVYRVPPLTIEGERVSSTAIRERILQGDMDAAAASLGRRYSLFGEVIAGRGIGATLGFPTANIKPYHNAIHAQGVYAAEACVHGRCYQAAVNIGIAPTIRQEDIVIEAFLLDFDEDILGATIELRFHGRLRSEKKFPSHEALAGQIRHDVDTIRDYFTRLSADRVGLSQTRHETGQSGTS